MDRRPLYMQIADRLALDIASGRYAVGTVLPREPDLAQQLQVSRSTLRAALAALERRKQVSRRKNAGTRVEAAQPQQGYGANLASLPDLVQWAQECARVVQGSCPVVLDADLAQELGCAPGSRWLLVQSLRFDEPQGATPVSWTDAYIDERHAAVLPAVKQQPSVLMSELLERHFGVELATVEQEVQGWKPGPAGRR
jgi:GntR family transcriptional regulator